MRKFHHYKLWAIADATGVPRRFMERGFEPDARATADTTDADIEDLRRLVKDTRKRMREMEEAHRALAREHLRQLRKGESPAPADRDAALHEEDELRREGHDDEDQEQRGAQHG